MLLTYMIWQTYAKNTHIIFYALSFIVVYFHSLILEKIFRVGGDKFFSGLEMPVNCDNVWTVLSISLFLYSEMTNNVCCFTYSLVIRQHKLKDSECSSSFLSYSLSHCHSLISHLPDVPHPCLNNEFSVVFFSCGPYWLSYFFFSYVFPFTWII